MTAVVKGNYSFASDNSVGIDPRILSLVNSNNTGVAPAYGADELSLQVDKSYSNVFEHDVYVFATPTGTAANGLAIGSITPSYGAIFCHEAAHIVTTECGAPEFFSGGARLVTLTGENNKISPEALDAALNHYRTKGLHQLLPSTVSVTQPTERGVVYTLTELAQLSEIAHWAGMKMHMDGARIANALVHLGVSPAEMTWKVGVDILSFGTTKNGTMNVDAVIAFDSANAEILRYKHKRAGFLQSKMRFQAAQLIGYIAENLWIENARKANGGAQRLAKLLSLVPGVKFENTVQANEIFVHLPVEVVAKLENVGITLRPWTHPDNDMFRIVTTYCDSAELISRFESALVQKLSKRSSTETFVGEEERIG